MELFNLLLVCVVTVVFLVWRSIRRVGDVVAADDAPVPIDDPRPAPGAFQDYKIQGRWRKGGALSVNGVGAGGALAHDELDGTDDDDDEMDDSREIRRKYPKVFDALWEIAEYIIRDFIEDWWKWVVDNSSFPDEVREILHCIVSRSIARAVKIDWVSFVTRRVLTSLKEVFKIYRYTEDQLLSEDRDFLKLPLEERTHMITERMMTSYKLHVATTNPTERLEYLRKVSDHILEHVTPAQDFGSSLVRTFGREILANTVLTPAMDFATPYWVNEGVRYLLSPDFLDAHDDAAKIIGELASDVAAVVSTEEITKSGGDKATPAADPHPQSTADTADDQPTPTPTVAASASATSSMSTSTPSAPPAATDSAAESSRGGDAASSKSHAAATSTTTPAPAAPSEQTTTNTRHARSYSWLNRKHHDPTPTPTPTPLAEPSAQQQAQAASAAATAVGSEEESGAAPEVHLGVDFLAGSSVENGRTLQLLSSPPSKKRSDVAAGGIKPPSELTSSLSEGSPNSVAATSMTPSASADDITNSVPPSRRKANSHDGPQSSYRPNSHDRSPPSSYTPSTFTLANASQVDDFMQRRNPPPAATTGLIKVADPRRSLNRSQSARSILPERAMTMPPKVEEATSSASSTSSSSGFRTLGSIMESAPPASLKFAATDMVIELSSAVIQWDPKSHRPYAVYRIDITNGVFQWSIGKRYSQFVALHQALKKSVRSLNTQLPQKKLLNNLKPQFIESRKNNLQHYLEVLMMNREALENEDLTKFLAPTEATKIIDVSSNAPSEDPNFLKAVKKVGSAIVHTPQNIAHGVSQLISPQRVHQALNTSKQPVDEKSSALLSPEMRPRDSHKRSKSDRSVGGDDKSVSSDEGARRHGSSGGDHGEGPVEASAVDGVASASQAPPVGPQDSISSIEGESELEGGSHNVVGDQKPPHASHTDGLYPPPKDGGGVHTKNSKSADFATHQSVNAARVMPAASSSSSSSTSKRKRRSMQQYAQLTKPIYELIEEIFVFSRSGNWLGKNVVSVAKKLAEHIFDGFVDKWYKGQVGSYINESSIVMIIEYLTDLLWPNGVMFKSGDAPTQEVVDDAAREASQRLIEIAPKRLLNFIGRSTYTKGITRVWEFFQVQLIVRHLAFSFLDSLVKELFPPARRRAMRRKRRKKQQQAQQSGNQSHSSEAAAAANANPAQVPPEPVEHSINSSKLSLASNRRRMRENNRRFRQKIGAGIEENNHRLRQKITAGFEKLGQTIPRSPYSMKNSEARKNRKARRTLQRAQTSTAGHSGVYHHRHTSSAAADLDRSLSEAYPPIIHRAQTSIIVDDHFTNGARTTAPESTTAATARAAGSGSGGGGMMSVSEVPIAGAHPYAHAAAAAAAAAMSANSSSSHTTGIPSISNAHSSHVPPSSHEAAAAPVRSPPRTSLLGDLLKSTPSLRNGNGHSVSSSSSSGDRNRAVSADAPTAPPPTTKRKIFPSNFSLRRRPTSILDPS